MERIPTSSRPSLMDTTTHLAGYLFIRNISILAAKPPFGVHLAAVASTMQGIKLSRQGEGMLDFRLHDMTRNYVECRASERHARNPLIVDKHELVMYGAAAQVGINKLSGYLWIYNECHTVRYKQSVRISVDI